MKLAVVIPAFNEQQSIGSVIERCLSARLSIIDRTPVQHVELIVVNDGSTDRTAEIARRYRPDVRVIEFERNRGYGAAIQAGWRATNADLLAFLDADGTCDPMYFVDLCDALSKQNADIALGCRLHRDSRMPRIRRLGNRLFAWLLTAFSFRRICDAASGMRVVRRAALNRIMPLPEGLHFTPAMSARAILSRNVHIVERNMPYRERKGVSKLKVLRDGLRFLKVILESAMLHRPSRPMGLAAIVGFLLTCAIMLDPAVHYLRHARVEEWMIYRFIAAELIGGVSLLLCCAGYLARKAADIGLSSEPAQDKYLGLLGRLLARKRFWLIVGLLIAAAAVLVHDAAVSFLATGKVYEHWSRFLAMSFLLWCAAILSITRCVDHTLNLLADRLSYLRRESSTITTETDDA